MDDAFDELEQKLVEREDLYDDLLVQLDDLRQDHLAAIEDLHWRHEREIEKVRVVVEKEHKRPGWKKVLTAGVCGICMVLTAKLNHESISISYFILGGCLWWVID